MKENPRHHCLFVRQTTSSTANAHCLSENFEHWCFCSDGRKFTFFCTGESGNWASCATTLHVPWLWFSRLLRTHIQKHSFCPLTTFAVCQSGYRKPATKWIDCQNSSEDPFLSTIHYKANLLRRKVNRSQQAMPSDVCLICSISVRHPISQTIFLFADISIES